MLGVSTELEQGTDEWLDARMGKITGSKIGKCFTSKLAISKAGCETLAKELATELLEVKSEEPPQQFESPAMIRGSFLELEAMEVVRFEVETIRPGSEVVSGGFFVNNAMNLATSPDGQVFEDGSRIAGVEIKCPMPKKHLSNLLTKGCPHDYYAQVQFNLEMVGVPNWYFASYYPGANLKLEVVHRDHSFVDKMYEVIEGVNKRVEELKEVLGI